VTGPATESQSDEQCRRERSEVSYALKRLIDVVISGSTLIVLLPFLGLIGALIKLDSSGPAIFKQTRVGARRVRHAGQSVWRQSTFTAYKFRSMYHRTSADVHQQFFRAYIDDDRSAMAALQKDPSSNVFKLTRDRRVTRFGRLLRHASLDELPQLWNVFKGDMSLVGPRPPIPYEVEMYSPAHMRRLSAKPGITGLWQVSGRGHVTFEDMVRLDVQYIEDWSVWLDLKILLLTVPVVLRRRGVG
jgi:lipopolysaccharide/colanic/teichoic acid biosynthesis glycosyltransferase